MENTFVFGTYEFHTVHVYGKKSIMGMLPETFVYNGEQSAAKQRELLNAGQVPDFGLQLCLSRTIVLEGQNMYLKIWNFDVFDKDLVQESVTCIGCINMLYSFTSLTQTKAWFKVI